MHAREELLRGEKAVPLTSVSVVFITVFFPKFLLLTLQLLIIVLDICAHFFFLLPTVLFITKALKASCLQFTEKRDDYMNYGRLSQDLHGKRKYHFHISCSKMSSSSRFALSASLIIIPLVPILSLNFFSIFTQLLFCCCLWLDLHRFFSPRWDSPLLVFPRRTGIFKHPSLMEVTSKYMYMAWQNLRPFQ